MTIRNTVSKCIIGATIVASCAIAILPVTHAEEVTTVSTSTQTVSNSSNDVQAIIKKMLEQIKSLQKQLLELQKNNLVIKDDKKREEKKKLDVEVIENIRVRADAGLETAQIAVQQRGMRGVIVEGPIERGGIKWYKVKYNNGLEGWSAANWLKVTERMNEREEQAEHIMSDDHKFNKERKRKKGDNKEKEMNDHHDDDIDEINSSDEEESDVDDDKIDESNS